MLKQTWIVISGIFDTAFRNFEIYIPYPKENDEKLQEYYDKVSSNKAWRDKAYFYPVDEPFDMDRIHNFNSITDRLTRLCPGYNMIVPFGDYNVQDPETGTVYTGISLEENKVNLLCPISSYFDDIREWFNGRVTEHGDIPWWYVCCGPSDETGLCNLFTCQSALKHRILFWQQKANSIAGFLYYDSINWDFVDDPWTDPQTFGNPNGENDLGEAGDGCFIYPEIITEKRAVCTDFSVLRLAFSLCLLYHSCFSFFYCSAGNFFAYFVNQKRNMHSPIISAQ